MHSKRKGRASSKKPIKFGQSPWTLFYDPQEIRKEIVKLKKSGISQPVIGAILRDQYGIPSSKEFFGKKLGKILEEEKINDVIPVDLQNLIKKAVRLKKHLETHKKDLHNKRRLHLIESKIHRLAKYYIREKKLPADWSYEKEAKLYQI